MPRYFKPLYVLMMVTAVLLITFAKVRNTESDSRAVLLVSEALLERHTLKLDFYGDAVQQHFGYTIQQKNGHYYGYFPLGSSIASLPFVALAHGWGFSMLQAQAPIQIAIACFTAVASLMLLLDIALLFLPAASALTLTATFWFGTSCISTMGTALWSHNFAVLFALAALDLALKAVISGQTRRWDFTWAALGACLFMAYLCRPTMALLSPFLLLYVLTVRPLYAIKAGLATVILLAGFVLVSRHEFHQWLPDYYLPQRLSGSQFLTALYGNLAGPSRGLLIFSPFLAAAWFCFGSAPRNFPLKWPWLLVGLAWPIAHLITICRFPVWNAGWSYGPRFMTDVLPGLFLLTARTWPASLPRTVLQRVGVMALAASALFAIDVNSIQALFNRYTHKWNQEPDTDSYQELLLDWRYPQFSHNRKRHQERLADWYRHAGAIPFSIGEAGHDQHPVYTGMMSAPGARLSFSAESCLAITFIRHDWSGIAKLYRDGVFVRDYDLYVPASSQAHYKEPIGQAGERHDYVLEVSDQANPASLAHQIWVNGIFPVDCGVEPASSAR